MDRLEDRTGYRGKQTEKIGLLNLDYASCSVFLSIVASSLFFLQQESRTLQEIIQNGKSNIFLYLYLANFQRDTFTGWKLPAWIGCSLV